MQWFNDVFVSYQLFSPSLQGVTLFLPVRGRSRELLRGAVSIEPSLSLCLLLGQVAFLITGSESPQTSAESRECTFCTNGKGAAPFK